MSKEIWRPGNMLYPLPSVLVTVADDEGNDNRQVWIFCN